MKIKAARTYKSYVDTNIDSEKHVRDQFIIMTKTATFHYLYI